LTYEDDEQESLRARSEQAIGELAQALIDSQALHNALSAAFGAREKAIEAQQAAMGALNLSSATDLERLERRLRSFSQRLEDVEEQIDELGRQIAGLRREAAKNGSDPSRKKASRPAKSAKSKSKPEG
jgi:chromosome segregation ATPase